MKSAGKAFYTGGAAALALLAVLLPILGGAVTGILRDFPIAGEPPAREKVEAPEPSLPGDKTAEGDAKPGKSSADGALMLTLLDGGRTLMISMEDYLVGAVAAEMPASFGMEALKAQAVALRTYVMYKLYVAPTSGHEEDICSNSAHCAAWKSEEYLRERWGGDYDTYIGKIRQAVSETDGQYLDYGGRPALAVFHASSYGRTEDSASVWGSVYPYLVSVETPESAENVRNFVTETAVSRAQLMEKLPGADPDLPLAADPVYDAGGRLQRVTLLGVPVTGRELRSLFGLKSTSLEYREAGDGLVFTAYGSGHGVGMSQYGANIMAAGGRSYEEILEIYYPGTRLVV